MDINKSYFQENDGSRIIRSKIENYEVLEDQIFQNWPKRSNFKFNQFKVKM